MMELVVVIVILGVIAAVVFPSLDGVSPKYRLRAGAREIGAHINHTRSLSGATGKPHAIHYRVSDNQYSMILPPKADEDPELPLDERERLGIHNLPTHVRFEQIILPDGTKHDSGDVDIVLDPLGNEGSHIVYLRNVEDRLIVVKFNALLGFVDFFNNEIEFEEYR